MRREVAALLSQFPVYPELDLELLERCGVTVDPGTHVPTHTSDTFETNVPGLYLAGSVVAGANRGEVFIENGRFHGRVVVEDVTRKLAQQELGANS